MKGPRLRRCAGGMFFAQCDVTKLGGSGVLTRKVEHQILGTDIVIPALENAAALAALDGWCAREGMLFAFDPCATRSPPPN